MSVPERFAFLKLITGGLRVGVSARLAKTALAEWSGKPLAEIEEVWHGLSPPYLDLFAWLEGRAGPPKGKDGRAFGPSCSRIRWTKPISRCSMPKTSWPNGNGTASGFSSLPRGGERRLFSRTGDDISDAFPDVLLIRAR